MLKSTTPNLNIPPSRTNMSKPGIWPILGSVCLEARARRSLRTYFAVPLENLEKHRQVSESKGPLRRQRGP